MAIAIGNPKKVKGNLKVSKPNTSGTGDDAQSLQGESFNPGADPLQDKNPVSYKKAPQGNNNEGIALQGGARSVGTQNTLQNTSSAVNAKPKTTHWEDGSTSNTLMANSGLKQTIAKKMLGKKKS